MVVRLAFPGNPEAIHLLAVFLPPPLLLIRFRVGAATISDNQCRPWLRLFQFPCFILGILLLGLIDCLLILSHVIPVAAGPFAPRELPITLTIFAIYFSLMAFAMFPGWRRTSDDSLNEWESETGTAPIDLYEHG
ncbi:MAG: hypothetical protein KDA80_09410 [Planctomycetaceae bacterium]|nr:hypothetical protein [Planctomycetaceae bacterium]